MLAAKIEFEATLGSNSESIEFAEVYDIAKA
jgi:hypothetical protein